MLKKKGGGQKEKERNFKKLILLLQKSLFFRIILPFKHGELAQLGEHNAGSVGVSGSNPLFSTILVA